jgi:hypothetical protein
MEILWLPLNQLLLTAFWVIVVYAVLIYCSGQLLHALVFS